MAKQLQLRRGNTAQNNTFTGAEGELSYDTQTHTVRVHNGSTAGGFPLGGIMDISNFRYIQNGIDNVYGGVRIEFSNGWQLYFLNHNRSASDTVNFDVPFTNQYYYLVSGNLPGSNSGPRYSTITQTTPSYFKYNNADDASLNNDGWTHWIVFGQFR